MLQKNKDISKHARLKTKANLTTLVFYGTLLGAYIITIIVHSLTVKNSGLGRNKELEIMGRFRHYFFTGWNFGLQIVFLILAILDETFKVTNLSKIQRSLEKARRFLFTTLVFPSSLLVMTVFWSIWHIDRELIFPKAIDEFYPTWLNHTLHTLIIIPLMVEILCQSGNNNYKISRTQAMAVVLLYSTIYKILYLSVYFQHGIWLYPVYKVLNWIQRIGFILLQFLLLIGYQQVGISLLTRGRAKESERKTK